MNITPKVRAQFRVGNCLLILLAVLVFNWGLQYKLSLYRASEAVKPTIPAAKLLSGKELTIWGSAGLNHVPPVPAAHSSLAALPVTDLSAPRPAIAKLEDPQRPLGPSLQPQPSAFSRPPPQNA